MCMYCEESKDLANYPNGNRMYIMDKEIHLVTDDNHEYCADASFCPMCGRNLSE